MRFFVFGGFGESVDVELESRTRFLLLIGVVVRTVTGIEEVGRE